MTAPDFYARVDAALRVAHREAIALDAWPLAGQIADLVDEVEFLEALRRSTAIQP